MSAPVRTRPLDRALYRLFMREAVVSEVEPVDPSFRIITFVADSLKEYRWTLGEKLQVALGSALLTRSYTPFAVDAEKGSVSVLAYLHGAGPGTDWLRQATVGERLHIFGPRRSLDLSVLTGNVVMFGDETSIGLSAAMGGHGAEAAHFFEAQDQGALNRVLHRLGVCCAVVLPRQPDNAHLTELAPQLMPFTKHDADFVLTGRTSSIQHIRQALRAIGVPSARVHTKAYWAPGKTGLD